MNLLRLCCHGARGSTATLPGLQLVCCCEMPLHPLRATVRRACMLLGTAHEKKDLGSFCYFDKTAGPFIRSHSHLEYKAIRICFFTLIMK